jgi:hypothetical protein
LSPEEKLTVIISTHGKKGSQRLSLPTSHPPTLCITICGIWYFNPELVSMLKGKDPLIPAFQQNLRLLKLPTLKGKAEEKNIQLNITQSVLLKQIDHKSKE